MKKRNFEVHHNNHCKSPRVVYKVVLGLRDFTLQVILLMGNSSRDFATGKDINRKFTEGFDFTGNIINRRFREGL